jgi:hypothetical protein
MNTYFIDQVEEHQIGIMSTCFLPFLENGRSIKHHNKLNYEHKVLQGVVQPRGENE